MLKLQEAAKNYPASKWEKENRETRKGKGKRCIMTCIQTRVKRRLDLVRSHHIGLCAFKQLDITLLESLKNTSKTSYLALKCLKSLQTKAQTSTYHLSSISSFFLWQVSSFSSNQIVGLKREQRREKHKRSSMKHSQR